MHYLQNELYVTQPNATRAFRLKTIIYVTKPISIAAIMKGTLVDESVMFGMAHSALIVSVFQGRDNDKRRRMAQKANGR